MYSSKGSRLNEYACAGNRQQVRGMLKRGASVNFRDSRSGSTALIAASFSGSIRVVRALLEQEGVDVNIKDNDGDTALIEASKNGKWLVVGGSCFIESRGGRCEY